MNNLRNRVNLIGNLGMNPEVKELESGKKFARLSLATSESYTNSKGEQVKNTEWHNLVAWGPKATFAEKYLTKGTEVAIEGKLTYRSYDDQKGNKKYITEVVVNEVLMLRSSKVES
ncbi:MAG: single-stranded DNA-binding protein [Bacteroidales bacterium]|nr:single-stranded DNA-binding protein [Bacteroidales bacterium]